MHKEIKRLLLGFMIWFIPFFSSLLLWDVTTNAPIVSETWFVTIMYLTLIFGFTLASYLWFPSNKKNKSLKNSLTTGSIWYIELVLLDFIVLVHLFSMPLSDYYPIVVGYLIVPVLSAMIGLIHDKK